MVEIFENLFKKLNETIKYAKENLAALTLVRPAISLLLGTIHKVPQHFHNS